MKVLAEVPWSWMLFEGEAGRFLSVCCGSVAIFTVDVKISEAESGSYATGGLAFIAALAAQIVANPEKFRERHLPEFDEMQGVKAAVVQWRAQRAAAL